MIKQQQLLWNGLVLTRDQVPKKGIDVASVAVGK
jgi:hypothetical protein